MLRPTMPDKEEAMATAIEMLQREAQKWVNEKKKKKETDVDLDLVLTNVSQSYSQMELSRGNMYRAFAYVKKSDILTTRNVIVSDLDNSGVRENLTEPVKDKDVKTQSAEQPEAIKRLLDLRKYEGIASVCGVAEKRGIDQGV